MDNILFLLEHYAEIEDQAFEEFWASLNDREKDKIEELEWNDPRYLIEGKRLLKKKSEPKKKDAKVSMEAKRVTSKRKAEKQKRLNKASKVFKKLRKYSGKTKVEKPLEESFVAFLVREEKEAKVDSRGPRKLLVLSKDGSKGLERLEQIAKTIYEDLGVDCWIEAGAEAAEEEREYGLFVSLSSYNEDEAKELEKAVEKIAKA